MLKVALIGLVAAVAGSSPQVLAKIQTGASPGDAVAAFGAIWVTTDGSGTLVRIDPRTNRVTKRIRMRPGLFSVERGFGSLWTLNYRRGSLSRVNPTTGRVRSVRLAGSPEAVVAAYGRLWVTAWRAGRLLVVDPRSMRVVKRITTGAKPTGLRVVAGALWVGFGAGSAIGRLDPKTLKLVSVPVGVRAPAVFTAGTRDLWIKANDNVMVRLDPGTRTVTAKVPVGRTLSGGALAQDGTIWIPDKEQNVVYRIDPEKAAIVDSFPAGPGAFSAVRANGSMWITNYAGTDVWRFRPAGP